MLMLAKMSGMLGGARDPAVPIVDDFEGTWTPNTNEGLPPNWSETAGLNGGTRRRTSGAFSGIYSMCAVPAYDNSSESYFNKVHTRSAFSITTHNRMKIMKCRNSGGNNTLLLDQIIKLNGVALTGGLILSSVNTGVPGPPGGGLTWYEYVINIAGVGNSLVLSIENDSSNSLAWPFFDRIEIYEAS